MEPDDQRCVRNIKSIQYMQPEVYVLTHEHFKVCFIFQLTINIHSCSSSFSHFVAEIISRSKFSCLCDPSSPRSGSNVNSYCFLTETNILTLIPLQSDMVLTWKGKHVAKEQSQLLFLDISGKTDRFTSSVHIKMRCIKYLGFKSGSSTSLL